ncbi:5'/3'-nucleotidase SurE [Geomonas paludis]|uniref:5'-nucleotidase SurE n=1 Tax=Geomonas paludis TaxID=2740185 RepID=A0A6V8MXB5_9BACT|nr:5'/3'-nucleotidase SurE [Geomonas paludis]UPU34485.1 5'/3'-nucleotidase SurE [Geomonas paludis]GFO64474.1 5'-nucleotidase SurE [Geomonas paludis]
MKILLTNDDGVHSPGLAALIKRVSQVAEVVVVAPDREQSAVSHALTLHHPLRAARIADNVYAVEGTPTDCVNLGIHSLLSFRPDLVISGVNRGANLGDDVTYSGTVAAALEATLMGIPAIAVSLVTRSAGENFDSAAAFAAQLALSVQRRGLPRDTYLNVNVPDLPAAELLPAQITRQGKRSYEGTIVDKVDPRGRNYYWIGTVDLSFQDVPGTDYHAVSRGHVSISPLHIDLTNHAAIGELQGWELP